MSLPVGPRIRPGEIAGYYIDLRTKLNDINLPHQSNPITWPRLYVATMQWGLACYERFLESGEEEWLTAAQLYTDAILRTQQSEGPRAGGWVHTHTFPHTYLLRPPWLSAMAQGQGASLLVRMFEQTGDERCATAARLALRPMRRDVANGGVRAMLAGGPFPEEYPSSPPSFVLNGGIFALWGFYDVAVGLDDREAREGFEEGVSTLVTNLGRWDTGYWSRYDLYPHPVANVASSFYHDLHIKQLRAMDMIAPQPQLDQTATRWAGYGSRAVDRCRAFAAKATFRVLVPRNAHLARRVPWSQLRAHRGPER